MGIIKVLRWIKSWEGKSFKISMLGILLCQFDKKIDSITSNIKLAKKI